VRSQAGWFSVQLAIQSEKASEQERGAEPQGGFFISA
jgi:hypothetical protein